MRIRKEGKVRKKLLITIFVAILLAIIIVVGGTFGYSYYLYGKVNKAEIDKEYVLNNKKSSNGKTVSEVIKEKEDKKGITNIALFGSDKIGLSDSIMILTVNNNDKQVKISSIMRDSWVNIPGYGEGKINWGMTYGGTELALKTINSNFDLALDKYIKVNLDSLPKIIDKLGGLDFAITNDELKYINGYIDSVNAISKSNDPHIEATGYQHLTGVQATAYCRIRYTEGNDFKRTSRQRYVFKLMYNKLSKLSTGELNDFVNFVLPIVDTNLSYSEITTIGESLISIGTTTIEENRFPCDGDYWDVMDTQYKMCFDLEVTKNKMHDFIFNEKR